MIKNILGLLDFSPISDQVILKAGELSKLYDAKCWLIHVAAPDPYFVGYEIGPQYIRDAKASRLRKEHDMLQSYKKTLQETGIDCEVLLIQGQINSTITSEIKKLQIDLVILGSHGHGRLYDVIVGSVCEYMLRNSKIPMLVIPSTESQHSGG